MLAVARISRAKSTADHGSLASSRASMAAPGKGTRVLMLENCPETGSSMQAPKQLGPSKRLTMPEALNVPPPTFASIRTVWPSIPPSVNTLATPSDVSRTRPRTSLYATILVRDLLHVNQQEFSRAVLLKALFAAGSAFSRSRAQLTSRTTARFLSRRSQPLRLHLPTPQQRSAGRVARRA